MQNIGGKYLVNLDYTVVCTLKVKAEQVINLCHMQHIRVTYVSTPIYNYTITKILPSAIAAAAAGSGSSSVISTIE